MGRSPISCIAGAAGFRDVFGAVGREGVDDLDGVPSVAVGGSVGEQDALKFWAGMSATRVGDWDGEAVSSCLRSFSTFILRSMGVVVVMERESEGVAAKDTSLAVAGAGKSAAFWLLRLALRDEL